ncbi:thiamine biosynthesis protein ThiJ [Maricaulis sp. W15]|uniref:DJ-1/PfpI family protein n=1 Tax=Maricaulis sp. W15 TaxID=1772333 RepID=UPI000948BB6D|nr:DJ-1/PfpI family protein [Maricaulis sp. W15]OLF75384.1 thiamine biosynthesis protein ThiJ [Maricaulis sp. W15]
MTTLRHIGFLLFDDLTQLDFTGPLQVLTRIPGAKVHLVARAAGPVRTDCGPFILADTSFQDCPQLDLICVPGGWGVDAAMEDAATLAFLRRQAEGAQFITSVCTGTFVLGAAGLLAGRKATTHWRYHSALSRFGAEPVRERVVRDGNLFTGGGVTAGIDFALTIVKELYGDGVAQAVQLGLEYDPHPPVDSGTPEKASAPVLDAVESRFAPRWEAFLQVVDRVADTADA